MARLTQHRGFTKSDARARIAAQATEEQRRAVADVWLDNSGSADELAEAARRPLARAHRAVRAQRRRPANRRRAHRGWCRPIRRGPTRPAASSTGCTRRVATARSRIDHIGSTAVPGLDAKDVIDVQVTVASLDVADELADALLAAGYSAGGVHGRRQVGRPQHGRQVRPHGRSSVVAQAGSRVRGSREGRRTCICGSTGGPVSSSRCCSATGSSPTRRCGRNTSTSSAAWRPRARDDGRLRRRQGAVVRRCLSPGVGVGRRDGLAALDDRSGRSRCGLAGAFGSTGGASSTGSLGAVLPVGKLVTEPQLSTP